MSKDELNLFPDEPALRAGKDEMNLVEHPFALVSVRGDDQTVIEIDWEQKHPKTGKLVKCAWRVAGDPKLGLPTPTDERLYLVLMELTKEARSQTVHFTRGDLIERLGISRGKVNYEALRDSFTRLKNVSVRAEKSFWNVKSNDFDVLKIFSILDEVTIVEEKSGRRTAGQEPLSSFKWSDAAWQSMQDGYVRTLDVGFALSLNLPLSLRLYRYLDKKRHGGRGRFEIDIARLCEIHLGMKKNPYLSKYRERIKPAHDELIAREFLADVEFAEMKTRKGTKVIYTFQAALPEAEEKPSALPAGKKSKDVPQLSPIEIARQSSDDLCDVKLERLKEEDAEEYQRIESDARELLGEVELAMFQRDPNHPAALHTLRAHMREIFRVECWWMLEESAT